MHVDRITTAPLLEGLYGTCQTLQQMAELVRKDSGNLALRQHALKIVEHCGGHEFLCEIKALFRYCRDVITYRRDPVEVEWIQDAARTIGVFGSGDCDDKIVCLATLLGCLGHKSRFVVIGPNDQKFTHVYLEVATGQSWLSLDPTPERAPVGWQATGMHRAVYEIWDTSSGGGLAGFALLTGLLWWWLAR